MKIKPFFTNPDYFVYRFWSLSIILVVSGLLVTNHYDAKEKRAFEKSKITFGIVDKVKKTNRARYIDFHYFTQNGNKVSINAGIFLKEFELDPACLIHRKKGDTVIVEYSLIDSCYAKIIHCYWNDNLKKKYGFYQWSKLSHLHHKKKILALENNHIYESGTYPSFN